MAYIIIIAVLAVLFGLRAVSCFILREDRSQIMMCLVYIIYVLFTINHRFMGGSVHSDNIFNLISYFLLTATYILVGEYIRSIYHNKVYKYVSIGLYAVLIILMINQYVLCALKINGLLFLIGMCEMSVIFVINAAVFLIKDFSVIPAQVPGKMGKRVRDVACPRSGNGKARKRGLREREKVSRRPIFGAITAIRRPNHLSKRKSFIIPFS